MYGLHFKTRIENKIFEVIRERAVKITVCCDECLVEICGCRNYNLKMEEEESSEASENFCQITRNDSLCLHYHDYYNHRLLLPFSG
jgi:hypothetical protein